MLRDHFKTDNQSFYTMELWNLLLQEVAEAGSISTLKTGLNKFMANRFVSSHTEVGEHLQHPVQGLWMLWEYKGRGMEAAATIAYMYFQYAFTTLGC